MSIWPSHLNQEMFASLKERQVKRTRDRERRTLANEIRIGVNDLPSIQHVSSSAVIDLHSLDSPSTSVSGENTTKTNGFLVLSNDGHIYPVKFQSTLTENNTNEQQNLIACFPQYVVLTTKKQTCLIHDHFREQSKDASKIIRTVFFDGNPSNLVSELFPAIEIAIVLCSFSVSMNVIVSTSMMEWSINNCVKSFCHNPTRRSMILFKLHWLIKQDRSSLAVRGRRGCDTEVVSLDERLHSSRSDYNQYAWLSFQCPRNRRSPPTIKENR